MHTCAIVVAAGKGVRLKSTVSKPLVRLGSKPVLWYSLQTLSKCPHIKAIVVVANRSNRQAIKRMISAFRLSKVTGIVDGGDRRQDSVINGLNALPALCDYVLIHDAARPLLDAASLERLIKGVQKTGAAILGVPVKSTIKEAHRSTGSNVSRVGQTLDRDRLWDIQTPQAFRKNIIMKAYNSFGMINVTDDSALVEKLGVGVSLVMGSYANIKITTPEDVCVAAALLMKRSAR
jgi:2-C-methyl-D-erythritol 4-phosphate cytidylyltransferase